MPCCKWQASSFCWECTLPHVCPPHAGWCFLQFWFLLLTLLPLLSHPPPIFTSCHHPISHTQSPPHPPSLLYLPGSVSLAVLVPSVHGMPASLTTSPPIFFPDPVQYSQGSRDLSGCQHLGRCKFCIQDGVCIDPKHILPYTLNYF